MHEFKYAFRRFYRGGSLNIIKVVSLALGLALSFLLLAKVLYELTFDRSIKDYERIYSINTYANAEKYGGEKTFPAVSGAVAPGMKAEIPQVEAATRWTEFLEEPYLYLDDNRGILCQRPVLADENFFDVFSTEILQGNPKQILTQKMHCMISDRLAAKIGPDAVGKQVRFRSRPTIKFTISGIYRHFPENSSIDMDVLVALNSIGVFSWDGTNNWLGNDRYAGYVKLSAGTDPASLDSAIYHMQQRYQDIDKIRQQYNADFTYVLKPFASAHLGDSVARTTVLLIGIIGIIVLVMSLLNYLLLRISAIISSSKATSIRKSLGAGRGDIVKGIMADTAFHLLLALLLAVFFIILFQRLLSGLFDVPIATFITPTSVLLGIGLLLLTGVLISLGPGRIVARQSIVSTIRDYKRTGRIWKKGLLFVEGLGVTFLLCTVFFVQRQYHYSISMDKGFSVENVFKLSTGSLDSTAIKNVVQRLRNMPEVENVSLAFAAPFDASQSGDNLFDRATDKEIRNVSDYFWCDENYFNVLSIPIVEGEGFDTSPCYSNRALVNETFAKLLVSDFGWTDGVVGKQINVTSHDNPLTIIGVFKNIKTCRMGKVFVDDESIVIAGGAYERWCEIMLLKLKNSDPATVSSVEKVINRYSTFGDVELISGEGAIRELYMEMRNLGNYNLFGSIVAILIALIGIVGYTEEEVSQRRKEIAIRKVNGAALGDILRLFLVRYLKISLPAILLGIALAFVAIRKWLLSLVNPVELSVWAFLLIGLGVLVVSCGILALYSCFAANQNPTKYLAEE